MSPRIHAARRAIRDQSNFPVRFWVRQVRKGETVEVQRMPPEDACSADMLVLIRWQSPTMAVPLSQLAAVNVDESTAETIARLALLGRPRLLLLIYACPPKAHLASALPGEAVVPRC
jgi:calcium binding protein